MVVGGAVLLSLSTFLPWVKVYSGTGTVNVGGLELDGGDARILLGYGAAVVVLTVGYFMFGHRYTVWDAWILGGVGFAALYAAMANLRAIDDLAVDVASAGVGVWLVLVASIVMLLGAFVGWLDASWRGIPEENRNWTLRENWDYYAHSRWPQRG